MSCVVAGKVSVCVCVCISGLVELVSVAIVTPVPGVYCEDAGESEALVPVGGVEDDDPVFGVEGAHVEG
jgi:hypothetical protein